MRYALCLTALRTRGVQRYFIVNAADSNSAPAVPREVAEIVRKQLIGWDVTKQVEEEKAQVIDAEAAKFNKTR
jgi:hypothetical protein